jgi:hypothetical protein
MVVGDIVLQGSGAWHLLKSAGDPDPSSLLGHDSREQPQQLLHRSFTRPMAAHVHLAVVDEWDERVTLPLQFLVHFVEKHVGQQRRERTTLRGPFARSITTPLTITPAPR